MRRLAWSTDSGGAPLRDLAARTVQWAYRGYRVRQSYLRCHALGRDPDNSIRRAVIVLQARARMAVARRRFLTLRAAVRFVQVRPLHISPSIRGPP